METPQLRKVLQGPDGFKTECGLEPTPEEIEAWHDMFCGYCDGRGSLMNKRLKTLQEQCDTQLPCPACQGTGRSKKEDQDAYHSDVQDVKVVRVDPAILDAKTFCPKRKVTMEFYYCYAGQQDGRGVSHSYAAMKQAYELGGKSVLAMNEWNKQMYENHRPI